MTIATRDVLVGIRIDSHSRQLLNWAIVKVAEPGDCVIAVHVVKSSGIYVAVFIIYVFLRWTYMLFWFLLL